ncbi:hypothetical protein IV203_004388 [Nitzschia inconspicua]|uniref:G-protein coupled receptors family 2 profile 2 domain-containing protein n=1 Tax=Nitzschia inconspicua TaxID=303405 RepID=A0A9K3PPN3_9STRA|nr:hypothetical protein IV203_004388 [Nitzschia inconspicua]
MMSSGAFTVSQQRALALVPKFTSSFSIPCSIAIIWEVLSDHRRGRGTTSIQRVLVGMSVVDICASSAWFLSTWAVPKESGWAFAAGNKATCDFQGFLLQMAIGAPLYNSSLALFYTLIIKLRWSDKELIRIERWIHGFILSFTIGTSFLMLFLKQYNQIGAVCWIIGDPPDCGNSSYRPGDVPCERGNWAWIYGVALFYGPLWICVIACVVSMIILYHEVKQTLQRASLYTTSYGATHSLGRSGNNSNKVAVQAMLYSLTFLLTWMPSTLWSIAHWYQWSHFALDMVAATAEPLQGFWNFLIFLRSRPETVRKIRLRMSILFPCCCTPPPPPRSSSAYPSSGLSDNNTMRREAGDEDESSFLRSVRSVKRRLKIFAGSLSRASSSFVPPNEQEDEDKSNAGRELNSNVILEDDEDRITSDLCGEDDTSYDDTSGKGSRLQASSKAVDGAAVEEAPTKENVRNEVEEEQVQEEQDREGSKTGTPKMYLRSTSLVYLEDSIPTSL